MKAQVETGGEGERSIVARYAEHVEQRPDRIAIRTPDAFLTYREVDLLTNRLAHSIPWSSERRPVAIRCDDEISLQVAQLGVLKSGRPLILMHPTEPPARCSLILEETGADVVVVSADSATAALGDGRTVIRMDQLSEDADFFDLEILPDDQALLQYTSGSSGVPKVVVHSHRTALTRTEGFVRAVGITETDRLILITRVTSLETFAAFLTGASLYPYDIRTRGIVDLPGWIRDERVSVFRSPPSVLRAFAAQVGDGSLPDLRIIVQAGEVLSPSDLDLFRSTFDSHTKLLHLYGSAEAGVATTQRLDASFDSAADLLPVGAAVPDVEVTVVDRDGQSVKRGEAGVISIASPSLAIGYLGRDDLTSERFVGMGTNRRFLSGDIGRFDRKGRLEFLGREDSQVKVRGQWVEIGEVETALRRIGGLAEAAVVTRSNAAGSTELVGYYTLQGTTDPGISDIRTALSRSLPDHMIPTNWVHVESFPMNATGKIDRKALPDPQQDSSRDVKSDGGALNRLAELWEDILGVAEVRMGDSFFDLGGDSLAAAGLLAAVEQEFGRRIPMADLFEHETLEFMAGLVEAAAPESPRSLLVPIKRTGNLPPLYCLDLPGWSGAKYLQLARHMSSQQPLVAVADDLTDAGSSYASVEEIATVYREAILDASDGPYHLLGQSAAGVIAYEVARQIVERGRDVGFVGIIDANYPGTSEYRGTRRLWRAVRRNGLLGTVELIRSRASHRLRRLRRADQRPTRHKADDHRIDQITSMIAACRRYQAAPFDGSVTYFRASDGGIRSVAVDRWRALGADVVDVAGTHTGQGSVLGKGFAKEFARALDSAIARAVD